MKVRQLEFGTQTKKKISFGGTQLKGNAREKRPFHKDMFTHFVMRSRLTSGERSMLRRENRKSIEQIVRSAGHRFSVKIERYVNVGNHLHLLIKAPIRKSQSDFLRTITGRIARKVMGVEKGAPGRFERFWDAKPFSKLVSFGKHYRQVVHYLSLNSLEAIGFTKITAREYLAGLSTA